MTPKNTQIAELHSCSRVLDGSRRARKLKLIEAISGDDSIDARDLLHLHDALLFIAAFPDDASIRTLAERGLRWIRSHIENLARTAPRKHRRLAHTGIAHTHIENSFLLDTLRWLVARFPDDVELIWEDESLGEMFDEVMPLLVSPVEYDGTLDSSNTTREWMALARGNQQEAAWLVAQFDRLLARQSADPPTIDSLFNAMELYMRWHVRDVGASCTTVRFPERKYFYHASLGCAASPPPPPHETLAAHLPKQCASTAARRTQWIDIARASLAARGRETDPVTYANPREVLLYNLERGIDIMLIGMTPDRRLPVEGFIGYIAAKNRIPIAYGGGWIMFDACTIGINLFEPFRGGESAHIFAQILRVYRNLFNIRTFHVDPFQFGQDNEEAIRSGAFWFYYRFGFRPVEQPLWKLAEREAATIAADRTYRTRRATLRRLATGRMRLDLRDDNEPAHEPIDVGALSLAVTKWIGRRFHGDRAKAEAWSVKKVSKAIDAAPQKSWPAAERRAFEALSPLMALIPNLANWPNRDRKALGKLMHAKGSPREIDYLHALNRKNRLHEALQEIARSHHVANE